MMKLVATSRYSELHELSPPNIHLDRCLAVCFAFSFFFFLEQVFNYTRIMMNRILLYQQGIGT